MLFLYSLLLIFLTFYSYVLVDPNLTLFQSPIWVNFRDYVISIGYYQRELSWSIYLAIILLLFFFHYLFISNYRQIKVLRLASIIGIILLMSYPFLSHDFFNYMFDAKILTFYQQNPYIHKALDFPGDPWLRFMHWTHRTYPYGPIFLLISSVPSFLSFGKFAVSFFLFKITFILFYIISVHFLGKLNKKWAVIFATHPLVIIEGLISSHNDLIGVSLGIMGIYCLLKRKNFLACVLFLFSSGIKYITAPIILLSKNKSVFNKIVFGGLIGVLIYISIRMETQPWYFLNIFVLLPFYEDFISKMNIFIVGLLLSYYPFIRLGGWGNAQNVSLKHSIIIVFFSINILYILLMFFRKRTCHKLKK